MKTDGDIPPSLPENYTFCELQIAGHHYTKKKEEQLGVLLNAKNGHLCKPLQKPPRGKREQDFYEYIWNYKTSNDNFFFASKDNIDSDTLRDVEELRNFVPKYFGVIDLNVDGLCAKFLELENVNGRFKKPCVADVKIGARTWDPFATPEKIETDSKKYAWAPLLGFRFLGMKLYDVVHDAYESLDSNWGKTVADTQVNEALNWFFQRQKTTCSGPIAACILNKLRDILHFFHRQKSFQFYSSSILISYEGLRDVSCDETGHGDKYVSKRYEHLVDVRMIDFTHVFSEKNMSDENYIHGLTNFVSYIEQFLSSL